MGPTSADRRTERVLVLALAISLLGDGMFAVGLSFAVFALGGSTSTLGLVVGAALLTLFITILPAGVLADRWSRRALVVGSDAVRAACQLTIGGLLIADTGGSQELLVIAVVFGLATAVHQPATQGFIPDVIGPDRLHTVNAAVQAARGLTMVVGAALAGVVVSAVGPAPVLMADGATFAACALLCAVVRPQAAARSMHDPVADAATGMSELRDAMRYVLERGWLREGMAIMVGFVFAVLGPVQIVGPSFARGLDDGARAWGYLSGALALGIVLGAVASVRRPPRRVLTRVTILALLGASAQALLAAGVSYGWALPGYLLLGASIGSFLPRWEAAKQARVDPRMRSKIAALDWFCSLIGMMSGVAVAVVLTEWQGLDGGFWFMAAGLASLALLAPAQRRLEEQLGGAP